MAVKPLWNSPPQFVDSSGNPYSGALLFFYAAGSSTKQNTYTDSGGGTACDNPITLNASGYPEVSGTIVAPWGTTGQTYKIGLAAPGSSDPPASFIWSDDNISPINDTTVTIDQWVTGPAPTYISATSFSLVGDQTSTFTVGRRVKTTNSGGTIYSTILTSAYTTLTTITVVNDSGTLDSGLSAVSYGLLSPDNPSTPLLADTYPIVSGSSDKTKKVRIEADGITTATTRVWTAPDSDIVLGSFADSSDATKKVTFGLSGITTATTRTVTFPDYNIAPGKYPTQQVFTSSSGTYTTPTGCIYIVVRAWGGGAGGNGGGTNGTNGGDTTFGTLTASGGAITGGTAGGGTNGDINLTGGVGGGSSSTNGLNGGAGGAAPMAGPYGPGGGGGGGSAKSAPANSGGGGGGGGGATGVGVAAGSAGGFCQKRIDAPSATYSYAVGAGGNAGTSSASAGSGGAGGSGLIIVDEFYS